MPTTIINPSPNNNSSNNNGVAFLIGIIIFIAFAVLFFVYGLPYIKGLGGSGEVNVNIPVPENIDIKVQKTE